MRPVFFKRECYPSSAMFLIGLGGIVVSYFCSHRDLQRDKGAISDVTGSAVWSSLSSKAHHEVGVAGFFHPLSSTHLLP